MLGVAVPTVVPLDEPTAGVIETVPDVSDVPVVDAAADVTVPVLGEVAVAEVEASASVGFALVLTLTLTELLSLSASPHLMTVS